MALELRNSREIESRSLTASSMKPYLRERLEEVEGHVSLGRDSGDSGFDVEDVDAPDKVERRPTVPAPRRVFPELITEQADPGEEQVYGAGRNWSLSGARPARCTSRRALHSLHSGRPALPVASQQVLRFPIGPDEVARRPLRRAGT